MSALSELLRGANREKLSTQKVTDLMRARGHDVGKDTVWKYMSGRHTVVRTEVLRAFVDVFPSLRLSDLQRAGNVPPEFGDWTPPAEARALDQREREALEVLIRAVARGKASTVVELRPVGDEDHQVPEAAMDEPPKGRRRSRPGESEEPWTER